MNTWKMIGRSALVVAVMWSGHALLAQENASAALVQVSSGNIVPAVVRYLGVLPDRLQERASIRFSIYAEAEGGSPLWTENQTASTDKDGKYTTLLGASSSNGLPQSVFADGQAHWLGVQHEGGIEERTLLASVPFAMKAADAATLSGKTVEEFVTSEQLRAQVAAEMAMQNLVAKVAQVQPMATVPSPTGAGTTGYVPIWTGASSLGNSGIYQTGSGSSARAGYGTTSPVSTIDVNGAATVRGGITLQSNTATASAAQNSPALDLVGSTYNSSTSAAMQQRFRWQVLTSGNDTTSPSASLTLGYGTTSASAPGLSISPKGIITFAQGQTFPGVSSGNGTTVNASSYDLGGSLFAFGSASQANAFLGFSGNGASSGGSYNTGSGSAALKSVTSGTGNSSFGYASLADNTTGYSNTASGVESLEGNKTGSYNTALGSVALYYNTTGSLNTAVGASAGPDGTSTSLSNTTAIGAHATVSQSNSLVLGQTTAGSPGTSHVNVGIGTATPATTMEISVNAPSSLGPTLTLSNPGGTTNTTGYHPSMASIDFKTYLHPSTANSPTSRIEAIDDDYGNLISFFVKNQGADSNPLIDQLDIAPEGVDINNELQVSSPLSFTVAADPPTVGIFYGGIEVEGDVVGDTKYFKIDHPADPANKYLLHTSVESSEMMNIYSGNVTTDERGIATVTLPAWFEAENGDFRYQLTTIGRDAHAWVSQEVSKHQFKIATDTTFVKVSWQITAVRQDAYAKAHPLIVEQQKPVQERGFYRHPELYGEPQEKNIQWARNPKQLQRVKAHLAASDLSPFAQPSR